MTKKSSARLMRDIEKKQQNETFSKNTCWSDLRAVQNQALEIIHANTMIAHELTDNTLIPFYENYKNVCIDMQTFAADLSRSGTTYQDIANKHSDKDGKANDHDEMMECFKISAEYAALIEDINGVMIPIVTSLLEQFGQAKQRQIDSRNPANISPEQDPSVITDVQVKDIIV